MINRELDFSVSRLSERLFSLSVLVFGFVVFSAYCAVIVSQFSILKLNMPFTTLEEFVDSDYSLGNISWWSFSTVLFDSAMSFLQR